MKKGNEKRDEIKKKGKEVEIQITRKKVDAALLMRFILSLSVTFQATNIVLLFETLCLTLVR
jgi:hypothetical protein